MYYLEECQGNGFYEVKEYSEDSNIIRKLLKEYREESPNKQFRLIIKGGE